MPTKKGTTKKGASKKGGSKKAPSAKKAKTEKKTYSVSGEHLVSSKVKTGYISGETFGLKEVAYSAVDGQAIFEGDIVLGSVAEMDAIKKQVENPQPGAEAAAIVVGSQFRWPDGVMIFRIDPSLPNQQRVTDAIQHWQTNSNVRFRQRTTETNFVTFTPGGGCSSQVGMRGGEQFITLGAGCTTGNTIHEIGHAAGLWHEQSREDRDSFVTINFANIQPGLEHNFNQHITDGDDIGPYDYGSIMHYPRNAFAINPNVDTITPKPNPNVAIGQRTGLSAGDLRAINSIYQRKAILGETSSNGPALTTRNNQLLLSWTGVGNLRLNFMSSTDGLNYSNKVTLGEVSPAAPALAVFQNRFIVAWIGVGNNRLNILQSNNGLSWGNKVTLGDTSQSSPALAVLGNQLFIAWRGVGNNRLNVMRSSNGVNWTGKVTLGDTTTSGPALATLGSRLLLGWRGVGNNQLNVIQSPNGTNFTGKVTLGETTISKPGLHASGGRALLTWQGVGNRFLNVLASNNGTAWTSKQTSSQTCIDGPVISNLGNRLVWGWTGTDNAHRLNSMLFNVV
ncbi:MAG TPA: M12 family metallopeptidase [Blastocatellia bacterium]|nr:M12 family metallopeptidase [Blastocatellia bacterium]